MKPTPSAVLFLVYAFALFNSPLSLASKNFVNDNDVEWEHKGDFTKVRGENVKYQAITLSPKVPEILKTKEIQLVKRGDGNIFIKVESKKDFQLYEELSKFLEENKLGFVTWNSFFRESPQSSFTTVAISSIQLLCQTKHTFSEWVKTIVEKDILTQKMANHLEEILQDETQEISQSVPNSTYFGDISWTHNPGFQRILGTLN